MEEHFNSQACSDNDILSISSKIEKKSAKFKFFFENG